MEIEEIFLVGLLVIACIMGALLTVQLLTNEVTYTYEEYSVTDKNKHNELMLCGKIWITQTYYEITANDIVFDVTHDVYYSVDIGKTYKFKYEHNTNYDDRFVGIV